MPLKFLRFGKIHTPKVDCIENIPSGSFAMKCSVKLFAGIREAIGSPSVSIEIDSGMTALECREKIASLFPTATDLIRTSRLAVSNAFVLDEYRLPIDPSVEIALIPPVSGG